MKRFILLLLGCFSFAHTFAQDKYFENTYDYQWTDEGRSLVKVGDEYHITTNTLGDFFWDLLYTRIGINGELLNLNQLENNTSTTTRKIHNHQNKIFIVGSEFGLSSLHDGATAELNIFGGDTLLSTIHYPNTFDVISGYNDLISLHENKLILTGGLSLTYLSYNPHPFIVSIDSLGEILWDTIYTQFENSSIYNISEPNQQGEFYAAGYVNRINEPGIVNDALDGLLLKIDSSGQIIWEQIIDNAQNDGIFDCLLTEDDGVLVNYRNTELGDWVIKYDSLGNMEWTSDILFLDGGLTSIAMSHGGNYIVSGSENSEVTGRLVGFVIKLDIIGNVLWRRSYGEIEDDDYIYDMILEDDGSIAMCGRKESGVEQGADIWLIKTNCLGLFTEPQSNFDYQVNETTVLFENLSDFVYPDSIDGGHYLWNFGDGTMSEEINPTHIYETTGAYEVTLTAVVCQDTSVYSTCVYLEENSLCCAEVEVMPIPAFSLETTDSLSISLENVSGNLYQEYNNGAQVLWDFGDGNTSTQFSPNHTFAEANFYDVTLSVILCGDTTSVFETVKVGEPVGIEEINNNQVKVYPNPATTSLTFAYDTKKKATLFLYNSLGQLVKTIKLNPSTNTQTISTVDFAEGIYYWRLGQDNGKLLLRR